MNDRSISLPVKCLQCNEPLTTPIVCDGCHTLYPFPQSADYFDLLSIPRTFDIDEASLARAYRSIARRIHPDRFSGDAAEAQQLSTRLTAEVNEAFSTLRDPVRRASYLLELVGGPSAVEVRDVPGSLLADVMMWREQIGVARARNDNDAIDRHRSEIEKRRTEAMQEIAGRADKLDAANDDERKAFRTLLNSIKYFDNLLSELKSEPLSVNEESPDRG